MKATVITVLLCLVLVVAGYFAVTVKVRNETNTIKTEIQDMKKRMELLEAFVKQEKEAREAAELPPDADLAGVIKSVNSFSRRLVGLEEDMKKGFATRDEDFKKEKKNIEETLTKQRADIEKGLKEQKEALDKLSRSMASENQRLTYKAAVTNAMAHVLKVKSELNAKNMGKAKEELGLVEPWLVKAKDLAPEDRKKSINEAVSILSQARADIDMRLPSALDRIDLLWHELSVLLENR
ncbi:MAG: hypothetical protein AB1711_03460 [Thermodesulfobacteriota bacterium]